MMGGGCSREPNDAQKIMRRRLATSDQFLRWIFELRPQSACVLGAQSNAGRKGLINTHCQ